MVSIAGDNEIYIANCQISQSESTATLLTYKCSFSFFREGISSLFSKEDYQFFVDAKTHLI